MTPRSDIAEVKALAQARIGDVLAGLRVDVPARGSYISMRNPRDPGRDGKANFTIWLRGAVGSWRDERGVAKGDIIDLVAYLKYGFDNPRAGRAEALAWLRDRLGLASMSEAQRSRVVADARAQRADEVSARDATLERAQAGALALFLHAEQHLAGTVAETYLRARRGIELAALPKGPRGGDRTPKFLRLLPHHKHVAEGGAETFWPCLVACCVDPGSGRILAVHRTWLTADGSDKAPVMPPRKCWPAFAGLVIPVWRGDSALSIGDACAAGLRETLGLTEGWEDALAWAVACPERRVWAAISLGNFANVALPDCIDSVLLARQNEWHNGAAAAAFDRGRGALEAQGRPVAEVSAYGGKDLSDTLRGAA